MLASLLLLRFAFERVEPDVPELLEKLLEIREPFRPCAVQAARTVASLAHEPRLLQDVQVLGDRRPRDVEVRRDLAGGELVVPYERQDPPPRLRGDGFERGLHGGYLSRCLRKSQLTNENVVAGHRSRGCGG